MPAPAMGDVAERAEACKRHDCVRPSKQIEKVRRQRQSSHNAGKDHGDKSGPGSGSSGPARPVTDLCLVEFGYDDLRRLLVICLLIVLARRKISCRREARERGSVTTQLHRRPSQRVCAVMICLFLVIAPSAMADETIYAFPLRNQPKGL